MNLTTTWMQSEWMRALGWTFIHSLWQIAIVGLLLFIVLRLVPSRNAHIRYTISTLAMWMMVVVSLSTFLVMLPETREISATTGRVVLMPSTNPAGFTDRLSAWLELRMPMMLTIWFGGVSILMLRLAISLGWMGHLRYESYPDELLQSSLDQIIRRVHVKAKTIVAESHLIPSPVTIGHLRPMILFPVGLVNQLSPKEVEAILTHELAHIVRKDYLSNLIQSFIETLFYYHPVTWWISRMVRTERENRADDLAISWCGDHVGYAKALITVQQMQVKGAPALSIGFMSRKGAMLARIQRILHLPYQHHNRMEKTVLLSLCSLCFLAFTLSSHTTPDQPETLPLFQNILLPGVEVTADSIPSKGTYRIYKKTDDQDISVEVEDGNIRELKVDGKEIAPSEYESYADVIEELFGNIKAPVAPMDDFDFVMPPMPPMPGMPVMPEIPEFDFDFDFEMPPMPPMPEIPEIHLDGLLNGEHFKFFGDGLEGFSIITDSLPDGSHKIIIISGGDSSVICAPHIAWSGDAPRIFHRGEWPDGEEWKKYEEEWREQADEWRDQWREHADQWREQQQEWREHHRERMDDQERMREELRHYGLRDEDLQRAREAQREAEDLLRRYSSKAPRMSLSDQMVRDGLIEPGDEVEVQLTPDRLKINGKKMPDNLHQKYLRMYEQQQGIELSGNSKVEFTTKSKQRM